MEIQLFKQRFLTKNNVALRGSLFLVISRFNCEYSGLELSAQLKTPQDIIESLGCLFN